MKVAILAGGVGSRLAEETARRSKAMVEIGNRPILWHIMRCYAHFGFREFVVALGYQADSIHDYFVAQGARRIRPEGHGARYQLYQNGEWTIDLVDTGLTTQNGGRLKRLASYLGDRTFMATWCDGLADVDLQRLVTFHRAHKRLATLTAVHPPSRFGRLRLDGDCVTRFQEKAVDPNEWVNGAFFVLEPQVLDYVAGDGTEWEREPLEQLAREGQLMAYRHRSFWQCMDTLEEARSLNSLWEAGKAPWKVWR